MHRGLAAAGLSEAEAARRLERDGPNVLPRLGRRGALVCLLDQVRNPLVLVLLAAVVATCAIGEPVDASVILGVVVANAAIGFAQEARAEGALDALARLVRAEARVLRDGAARRVPSAGLVVGDLVLLEPGDRVSADARLLEAEGLHADESALTGESVPVAKAPGSSLAGTPPADRRDLVFSARS